MTSRSGRGTGRSSAVDSSDPSDSSWWGWGWGWAKSIAGHFLKEMLKDVGAHVACQSAVAFLASHDPHMSDRQKQQLNDMLIRAYYAWKAGKPVQPMLRGVIALVVADPDRAQAVFHSIVGVFAGATPTARSASASGAGAGDHKVDASYFPPPPSHAPNKPPAFIPMPSGAAAGDAKGVEGHGRGSAAAPAAPAPAAAGRGSASVGAAAGSAKPALPQPSAPPLYPDLKAGAGTGGGPTLPKPSAPSLDAKDLKVDAKQASAGGASAAAGAKPATTAGEADYKTILIERYGIARSRVEAIPGGLYPSLVTALRDNPSCSITLDDCVGDDGRVVGGVSALFQFGHGNGKYFCFLFRSHALDEWFRSEPHAKPTNPATRTPIDVNKQTFRLS